VWSFAPQVVQPIFTAGRLKSNVKLAEAERERALIQYEKAIQTAFAEVSDALIAHQKVRESREQQELLVAALRDRTRLAYVRYRGGVDTLLNALDADRDQFQAELNHRRSAQRRHVVQLYKALGGGNASVRLRYIPAENAPSAAACSAERQESPGSWCRRARRSQNT
jgi:multidrug efflux system outer membrane protein